MDLQERAEFIEQRKKHIDQLIEDNVSGVTKRDILPNTAQPLQGEVEAMYFKELREFFKNSISRNIMDRKQDLR